MHNKIYSLKSTWARQIHRFHTLGNSQLIYRNDSVGITESKTYSRHISDINEHSSNSLLGDTLWKVDNWSEGWAVVNESKKIASLNFRSRNGDLFHRIQLNESSQWDCFECLLKLFAKPCNVFDFFSRSFASPRSQGSKNSCSQLIKTLTDTIEKEKTIRCTLPTSGGIITRNYLIKKILIDSNIITLTNHESKILIDTNQVDHVGLTRSKHSLLGTLHGSSGTPKLMIEAA